MKDNSDIPLPADQLKSKVLVFAITDELTHEYEQITKGYVQLSTDEDEKNNTFHYLQVKDQNTNQVLMRSNLKIQNNFGKQKGSIISWTDEQQPQYQQIALSFEKDRQCDMFWRTICEKIGKSYLQINGTQKLDTPTVNNLNYILQKAKNSIDLIDYNIVHSKSIMDGMREVFYQMKRNNDQMGMGTILRIINAIMCPTYSSNANQILFTGDNFYLILDLQEFKKGINFRQVYEQKVGQYLLNKFNLPVQVYEKIELSHRATFYRQNVLQLSEDSLLQSMMFMMCKQALVQIMSYLNRVKFIQKLINYEQYPNEIFNHNPIKANMSVSNSLVMSNNNMSMNNNNMLIMNNNSNVIQEQTSLSTICEQLNNDKISFIHESLVMYNQITSQQIKLTFKQNIYVSGLLNYIKQNIQQSNIKALQILYCINQIDKQRFFEYLIQQFKQNSSDNMLKTLMRKYLNEYEMRYSIIALIQVISPLFNIKKQLFDFFNGTFICSIFSVAKDSKAILLLANVLLSQLQNSSVLFNQFIKSKICQKIANQYRTGLSLKTKVEELQMLKFLKHIIIQQSHKGQVNKHKQIQKNIIQSGLFECCMMIYFKHSQRYNVLSSSMLQNLKLIQRMSYSQFDSYLIKEYSSNQSLVKILIPIKAKYIEYINRKNEMSKSEQNYLQMNRMVHEQILQNEEQDNYLMNQNQQYNQIKIINNNQLTNNNKLTINNNNKYMNEQEQRINNKKNQQNNNINILNNNNNRNKQQQQQRIIFLKRMMDEINQEQDNLYNQQRQPRKIIKKSQDSKQTNIQFSFDLPDIDQLIDNSINQHT